jgi:Tfp pilus assembly protein PilO
MLIFILGILLLLLLLNYMPLTYKEGATTEYDETSCQSIAKQNQNDIDTLQTQKKTILDMQSKVDNIKIQLDGNTTQLSSLADQVYKMPE